MRFRIYETLEGGARSSKLAQAIDAFLSILILTNVCAVALETVDDIYAEYGMAFRIFEYISVSIFSVEYLTRL